MMALLFDLELTGGPLTSIVDLNVMTNRNKKTAV